MLPRTAAFAALALALAPNAPLRAQMEYPTYVEAKVDDTLPDIAVDLRSAPDQPGRRRRHRLRANDRDDARPHAGQHLRPRRHERNPRRG